VQDSRRKLIKVAARAMLVLLVVTAVCLFSINGLKREVTHLVQQTLPGLQYAAMADSLLCDGYIRCLNLVSTSSPEDLAGNLQQIEEATRQTDVYLEKYRDTIFDKEDQANYSQVQIVRDDYLRNRDKFFALLKEQRRTDALHCLKTDVTPAYNNYSQFMSRMFEHKVKIGEIRRDQVMVLSFMTPIVVSILFILLFVLGLLVSFKFIVP
jgi:CHASE3 domain sensor protein